MEKSELLEYLEEQKEKWGEDFRWNCTSGIGGKQIFTIVSPSYKTAKFLEDNDLIILGNYRVYGVVVVVI